MIKYIEPQELLITKQFIREPVDNLAKEIFDNASSKIVLNGGRGTGKSVILHSIENKGLGTNNPTIYTLFDSIINFSVAPNEIFNEMFFEHYYELCFSWKLLKFIENNYAYTYEMYFKDIELLLENLLDELDKKINKVYLDGIFLSRYLSSTEISAEIVKRLKDCLSLETFNLAIDRFDWTNGRSIFSQQILSRYFDLFNKVIITSDDESLIEEENRRQFEEKGYSFITANYGKNIDVVKCLIKRRIELHNVSDQTKIYFDANIITDEIYQKLINKTNGNISSMIFSINDVADWLEWYNGDVDVAQLFDMTVEEQVNKVIRLKKRSIPPRLYL